jgi:hypothetical protein
MNGTVLGGLSLSAQANPRVSGTPTSGAAHSGTLTALPLRGPSRSKRTATNVTASKNRRAYSFEQAVPIYRRG